MTRPIVPLLFALVAGILLGGYLGIPDPLTSVSLALSLFLLLVSLRLNWHCSFHLSLLMSFLLLGSLAMGMYERPNQAGDNLWHRIGEEKITGEGTICENPQVSPDGTALIISVYRILRDGQYQAASGRLLLRVGSESDWEYGDVIRFRARLRKPHNFQNPGGFDYERYLRLRRVLVVGTITDPSAIIRLRKNLGNPVLLQLEGLRSKIRRTLIEKVPGDEGRIIQAMTLGDKRVIPKNILEYFNKTGTTHLIAISGLNVGIVALVSLCLFRWILGNSEYLLMSWNIAKIAAIAAMIAVLFYMFIAGAEISVVRATIMVLAFMMAFIFNRTQDLYQALALAAFLILLISPASLFDISFQLSFAAVFFILFLSPRLISLASSQSSQHIDDAMIPPSLLQKAWGAIVAFAVVSLSATLGTLPLILFYFNRLSIVNLAANFVVVPILGLIATPLFLLTAMAISILGDFADPFLVPSVWLVKVALFLIEYLAALPYSAIFLPTPTIPEMTAFYIFIIALGFAMDNWHSPGPQSPSGPKGGRFWPAISIGMILFIMISTVQLHLSERAHEGFSLTALDVGQGSAILVRFPRGRKMLIDGGGYYDDRFDIGRSVVAPYLWHQRINRIDTVVLTHPHPDHLQGLLFILEHFHVREIWTNGDVAESPLYQSFLQIAHHHGLSIKAMTNVTLARDIAGVRVEFFNPRLLHGSGKDYPSLPSLSETATGWLPHYAEKNVSKRALEEANDRSLIIKFTYRGYRFLLPADISTATEDRLVQSRTDLKSEVLFVPHHGSSHSSSESFVNEVGPLIGVISCGRDNPHRFPHPEVLKRYQNIKTRLFRTDRNGAITVETDGRELKVSTFTTREY